MVQSSWVPWGTVGTLFGYVIITLTLEQTRFVRSKLLRTGHIGLLRTRETRWSIFRDGLKVGHSLRAHRKHVTSYK